MKKGYLILFINIILFMCITNVNAANVAKIGTTEYDSIDSAISAASDNQEIELLADITEITIPSGKNIILNLSRFTVEKIDNSGTIEIKNGTIHEKENAIGQEGLINNSGGEVTISGVNFNDSDNVHYLIKNEGKMTINNATITTDISNGNKEFFRNESTGDLTIENGTINGFKLFENYGKVTINGGTLTATTNSLSSTNFKDFIINGGTFNAAASEFMNNSRGNLTINGGTFNVKTVARNYDEQYQSNSDKVKSIITINNGTFNTTDIAFLNSVAVKYGEIYFNGGTINSESAAFILGNYLADNSLYITGGTINAKNSAGIMSVANTKIVVGKNDDNVSGNSPVININKGVIDSGDETTKFEFYDGKIVLAQRFTDNKFVKDITTPKGYYIKYDNNNDDSFTAYLVKNGSSGTTGNTILKNPNTGRNIFIFIICSLMIGTLVFIKRKNKISNIEN